MTTRTRDPASATRAENNRLRDEIARLLRTDFSNEKLSAVVDILSQN